MENKREKLMNPDEYIDLDQRTFTQQMADINVEVVRMKRNANGELVRIEEPKDDTTEKIYKQIVDAGQKGKISPQMVLKHTKEKLEGLINEGFSRPEIAEKIGVGTATLFSLFQVHGITLRAKTREKPTNKKAATTIGDTAVDEKAEKIWLKANPRLMEEGPTITRKTIRTTAQAAGGEVLGTAKMLEKLGELQVVVEIRVMEGA